MNVSHFASFNVAGGIGLLCATLIHELARRDHGNVLVNKGDRVAEAMASRLPPGMPMIGYKAPQGVKLPAWIPGVRQWGMSRALTKVPRPDVLLSWSQLNAGPLIAAHRKLGARAIHYDHGSAWRANPSSSRLAHLAACDGVICVSHATRRMLQLRWGVTDIPMVVQHNPLIHPVGNSAVVEASELAVNRRWRLGVAGRLVPVKGFPIAIRALRRLVDSGLDAELHVLGSGMMQQSLKRLVDELGLADRVIFHGFVDNMSAELATFDLLLCPSFRETFGLVSIEAAAVGCPVIGSRVDGLPETLSEGVSGLTLPCTEAVESLTTHADHSSIPPQVYDPDTDQLRVPLGVSPERLAESVAAVLGDPERHLGMRQAGQRFVREHFALDHYVDSMTRHLQTMGTT
ncbi:glycosyltransferase family 4 protein [Salinicola sp. V024]|jgi:glycosyltransferase involved in cell wall biosynthesis|uniref:glycosyltransferase family 4 protein n=1 Tax=Salinicola sp. V024 TaxID=3459609 RepID=UPI002EA7CFA0|nr:glycosyltransferase family 4 protein [Pseudomonadota bacterium]MED5501678.1 glycosyltransferase family 4 protein [Pseudomonadota bacterium]